MAREGGSEAVTALRPPQIIRSRLQGLSSAAAHEGLLRLTRESPREWAALQAAMTRHRAACASDPRFTAEDPPDADTAHQMRRICNTCPIRDPCETFAAAAQPTAGFWAGTPATP